MHTYSFHNGLIQLSKPLILATEATVKARIYTYFTGGRGEEIPATELIGALQRDDADAISSLVSSFSEYAKVHAFSDVVMGCTHLSEVADLFKMQGLSVYDPLSRVLDAAPCLYVEGDKLSLTVHATGDPTDVLNYVNRRISALPEEVLLDAEY
jgi:glutamate racemase